MAQFIQAYDPVIKRRVLFQVQDGVAISTVSGHKFKYTPR